MHFILLTITISFKNMFYYIAITKFIINYLDYIILHTLKSFHCSLSQDQWHTPKGTIYFYIKYIRRFDYKCTTFLQQSQLEFKLLIYIILYT